MALLVSTGQGYPRPALSRTGLHTGIYGSMVSLMNETLRDTASPAPRGDQRRVRQNGLAIRALREKDGWSQASLARQVGIKQQSLSAIEIETDNAGIGTLNLIARAMRVPVAAIMRDCDGAEWPDRSAAENAA